MNWHDEISDRPPPPDEVKSGAFSYGPSRGFRSDGEARAPLKDLRLLFRKGASRSRRTQATVAWLKAQLRLYGVTFTASAKKDELFGVLERAVKTGKCNTIMPEVQGIEDSLRRQFAEETEAHKRRAAEWERQAFDSLRNPSLEAQHNFEWFLEKYFLDSNGNPDRSKTQKSLTLEWSYLSSAHEDMMAKVKARIPGLAYRVCMHYIFVGWDSVDDAVVETFDGLDISGSCKQDAICDVEANLDFDRFLKQRFLVDFQGNLITGGKPQAPVVLTHWFTNHAKLDDFSRRIPRMYVKAFSHSLVGSGTVMGWDALGVKTILTGKENLQKEREDLQKRQREEETARLLAIKKKKEDDFLRPYRQYTATHPPQSDPVTGEYLVGSYIVMCDRLDEIWEPSGHLGRTMDIFPAESEYGQEAHFDFDQIRGTMLLGMSWGAVESLEAEQPTKESYSDEESDAEGNGILWNHGWQPSGSSSIGTISDPYGVQAARARRDAQAAEAPQIKEQKMREPATQSQPDPEEEVSGPPNRVYFHFRSRLALSRFLPHPAEEQVGYLDFDPSKHMAQGTLCHPDIEEGVVPITLYRVSSRPQVDERDLEDWYKFLPEYN